jgi:hypothetical protein
MKAMILSGAAALVLLAVPAAAQNSASKTIQPNDLTVEAKKPPLQLSDEQKNAIQNALVAEHTQQKTPKDFQPQVGTALPISMKADVMPEQLGREQPALKQYGYAKTAKDILVLDPMKREIIAVLPRKFPATTDADSKSPASWADTKGRELTGQAPQAGGADHFPEPAGDSGDIANGNEKNAKRDMQGGSTTPK